MRPIILGLLLLAAAPTGYACTVCGCSASNQYLGVLPDLHKHFAAVQYQHRGFRSQHPGHGETGAEFSKERYSTLQVWGKANVGKRIQVFAFVPYVSNASVKKGSITRVSGLGDVTALVNVRIAGLNSNGKTWQHNLQAGGGLKAPTGKYDGAAIFTAEGLPNMQPGTNAWDIIINGNYTVRRNSAGVNIDASYTLTTANSYEYKYGNRISTGLMGFYWLSKNQLTVLPQAGVRLDVAGCDYDNYTYRLANDMSGGEQLYASAGIQAYYKRFGCQFMYHLPLAQHYASGLVDTKYKMETTFFVLF